MFLPLAHILMCINPIYNPWPLSSRSVSILSCCLSIVLPHDLIPSSFWTTTSYTFCSCHMPVACPVCVIVFIYLSWWHYGYEASHYTVFFSLQSLSPLQLQVLPYFPAPQFVFFPPYESPTLTLIILQQDYICVQFKHHTFRQRQEERKFWGEV